MIRRVLCCGVLLAVARDPNDDPMPSLPNISDLSAGGRLAGSLAVDGGSRLLAGEFEPKSVPPPGKPLGVLWVAPHKSGSTFLKRLLGAASAFRATCHLSDTQCYTGAGYCKGAVTIEKNHVPLNAGGWPDCYRLFKAAIDGHREKDKPHTAGLHLERTVYVYGPHRDDTGENSHFADVQHDVTRVWQLRHPLDSLVSQYRSYGWTHPKAPGMDPKTWEQQQAKIRNTPLETYALSFIGIRKRYIRSVCAALRDGRDVLSSYELMVGDFPGWLRHVATVLRIAEASRTGFVDDMVGRFAMEFQKADTRHKSFLFPGSHRTEMSEGTIARLKQSLLANLTQAERSCLCDRMYSDICE